MSELRTLQDAYHEYRLQCQRVNMQRLEYTEWLEQVAISALEKLDIVNDELAHYQHAATLTHDHYLVERKNREAMEAILTSVRFLLFAGRYEQAGRALGILAMLN